jgi:hypothetical protein
VALIVPQLVPEHARQYVGVQTALEDVIQAAEVTVALPVKTVIAGADVLVYVMVETAQETAIAVAQIPVAAVVQDHVKEVVKVLVAILFRNERNINYGNV